VKTDYAAPLSQRKFYPWFEQQYSASELTIRDAPKVVRAAS